MTMCITPNNVVDAKRQRAATPEEAKAQYPKRDGLDANPRVRILYDNLRFININLTKLSQMLYTNTTYLSKVVNKYFGCNLKTLLNRYRVDYAKELLRKDECNMEELPARCGFISRSTFYTAFMKFEHMTPSDYRANMRTQALRAGVELGDMAMI